MTNKKFKHKKLSRFTTISKSLFIAGTHLTTAKLKEKINSFERNKNNLMDLSGKIKASKEIIETMGSLKGGLMKLGQMISITEDLILPPEISALFKQLQKSAPPMNKKDLDKIFIDSFFKLPEEIFQKFNPVPIAAASIGQVHEAWLSDGTKVAVKVQYPKIREAIISDFKNIDKLKSILEIIFPNLPNIDIYIEEMKRSIIDECDYQKELENIVWFKQNVMPKIPGLYIPETYKEFSSDTILTMEFVSGDSIELANNYPISVKNKLGQIIYDTHMLCLYELNQIHADPQNGNYLFNQNEVILLDFGSIKKFPTEFIKNYIQLIKSIENNDFKNYKNTIQHLGFMSDEKHQNALERHFDLIREIYLPYTKEGIHPVDEKNPFKMLEGFIKTIDLKGISCPREEFLLLDRSNLGLYTKLKYLGCSIDWTSSKNKSWDNFKLK